MANRSFWNMLSRITTSAGVVTGDLNDLLLDATSTGQGRVVYGTGSLVTGALTVATGLTTIINATVSPAAQPTGTGTASMQILVPTWATGALTITAYSVNSTTGGTAAASTSTGVVSYIAVGL